MRPAPDTFRETPLTVFALVYLEVVALAVLVTMPMLVGATMDRLGFSASEAASIPAADMLGAAIAALVGSIIVARMPWRIVLACAVVVLAMADLASGLATSPSALFSCRIVGGLCEGMMVTIANASIAETRHPDRYYAFSTASQLTFGAVVLLLLPGLLNSHGLEGAFWALGLLSLVALPVISRLPGGPRVRGHSSAAHRGVSRSSVLALTGLLALYMAQGGVWSFLDRMGAQKHITAQGVAQALSISAFAGMLGALLSSWLELRFGRLKPLCTAVLLMIACMLALRESASYVAFAGVVSLFNFAWYFSVAYQFGALAAIDPTRRAVGLGGFVAFSGLTLGPVIAAAVAVDNTYSRIIWAAVCSGTVGLGLLVNGLQRSQIYFPHGGYQSETERSSGT